MKNQWKPVLIVGGLLIVLLTAIVQSNAAPSASPQPTALPRITATLPPPTETPYASPTPKGARPPQCTFPLAPSTAQETPAPSLSLEDLTFSEPQVVLTHTSAIGIVGWLSDGQRVLITRRIPGQAREYVEVFDTRTGELQRYGERHSLPGKPVWLAAQKAVAFADVSPDKQVVLRIGRGDTAPVETPISGLAASFLGTSPDGRQVSFFTQALPNQLEALYPAQSKRAVLPAILPPTSQFAPYRLVWHPQGHQIAFYNETGFYLADLPSGHVCEIDLGFEESEAHYGKRWAFYAQWSPDGRYLAMLTTVGNPPVHFTDLTVLDTSTGEVHSVHSGQYVMDMAWAPNAKIIAIRSTVEVREGVMYEGLYLIEVATGQNIHILPQRVFTGGDAGWNLSWSHDGQQIALSCPTINEGRLCLIAVTTR